MQHGVFVNGIWKSGNNLLLKLTRLAGIRYGNLGIASSLTIGSWPIVRKAIREPWFSDRSIAVGIETAQSVSFRWMSRKLGRCKGSCISGHAPYSGVLLDLLLRNDFKSIQIVRDPADVLYSYARWIDTRADYFAHRLFAPLSQDEKLLALLRGIPTGPTPLESFATVLDRSYEWVCRPEQVLVVRFEDLVGAKGGGDDAVQLDTVQQVFKWIGVVDVDVEQVVSSLFGGTNTFRSGQVGQGRNVFSSSVEAEYLKQIGPRLAAWGYA